MPMAKVNGTQIYYEETRVGIPILFIHPPLLTSKNFVFLHEQLSDQFRVISFDIRGHGQSEPSDEPLHYQQISDDIIGLLDVLQIEKCFICGYSTGGTISLEAMLSYPHRFYGGVQMCTMPEVSDWVLKNKIRLAVGLSKIKAKKLLASVISYGNANDHRTYRLLHQDALRGNIQNIYEYYKYSLRYRCTDQLTQLTLPQLLIYGKRDRNFLRYAYMLWKQLPSSEIYLISGKSHQLPTKASERISHIIRHWALRQWALDQAGQRKQSNQQATNGQTDHQLNRIDPLDSANPLPDEVFAE